MGEPLAPCEQIELLSLMQLVTGGSEPSEPPAPHRSRPSSGSLSAQLIGEGVILAAEIRTVSAAALVVVAHSRVATGSRICLQAADAIAGVEYTLPCQVAWTFGASPSTLALVVDGVPSRTIFGGSAPEADLAGLRPSHISQVSMQMGPSERLVG